MNIKNWTRENIIWLAGYAEGEGSFSVKNHIRRRPRSEDRTTAIKICSTDLDVLKKAKKIAACGRIYARKKQKQHHKRQWELCICKQTDVYALSSALFQFMGKRRKQQIKNCILLLNSKKPYNLDYIRNDKGQFIKGRTYQVKHLG